MKLHRNIEVLEIFSHVGAQLNFKNLRNMNIQITWADLLEKITRICIGQVANHCGKWGNILGWLQLAVDLNYLILNTP